MDFNENSISLFLTLDAIFMTLYGILYTSYIDFFKENEENPEVKLPNALFFLGGIIHWVHTFVLVSSALVVLNLIVIYFKKPYYTSILFYFNGGAILFFALGIVLVFHRLTKTILKKG